MILVIIVKVEEIKQLKSGKYKVKIDGQVVTTYDDVILNNHLLFQKEITNQELEKIILDNESSEIYHKALNYALRKIRSIYEMRKYLEKMDIDAKEIENIIQKLQRIGVLSDNAYVKAYISDSVYLSNDGPEKIKKTLLDQEIEESIVLEEMEKIDYVYIDGKLEKLIQKRILHDHKRSSYQLKQKITIDMVNLGYSRDSILDKLSKFEIKDDNKLEKEYMKLRQKLERKYTGKELFRKIQEKLYSKGFDINDIQSFIDKKKSEGI